jgi:hypothetical protein
MSNSKLFVLSTDGSFSNERTISTDLPPIAGWWVPFDGVKIPIRMLPNKFYRFMMRLVFGWSFEIVDMSVTTNIKSTRQLLNG